MKRCIDGIIDQKIHILYKHFMNKLMAFFVLLDLACAGGCLVMPRSGMEAMGAVFILLPILALNLAATCKKEMPAIVRVKK